MMNTTPIPTATLLLLAGLFGLALYVSPAHGQSAEQQVRTIMEQRDRDIKKHIQPLIDNPKTATEAQRRKVESLINDRIDFEAMGRKALGPFWNELTAAQRKEFVDVFSKIVRSQSLADVKIYQAGVRYETVKVVGDSAYVKTTTQYKDKEATVEYVLGKKGGEWWLHDIILDEVGTVEGYARSFRTAIRKRGFDGFMDSLYAKLEKIQASS